MLTYVISHQKITTYVNAHKIIKKELITCLFM
jgi:hypothetical protein